MKEQNQIPYATDVVRLMIHADRLHRAAIEAQVNKLGIHRSQHIALMNIAKHDGQLAQADVARSLDISPAAVTVTLQKLERSGFITRCHSEGDARSKTISLTEAGKQTVQKTHELFSYVDELMCGGLTGEELEIFCRCIERMSDNLRGVTADQCCKKNKEENE